MSWFIIGIILFAAFGPIIWLVPSRSDRRLAKMRARARTHGIQVEITQLDDLAAAPQERVTAGGVRREPKVQCTAYRLGIRRLARAAPEWKILRSPNAVDGPIPGWIWDAAAIDDGASNRDSRATGDTAYWQRVSDVVRRLPVDALACASDATEVSCWWRERASAEIAESSVDQLYELLNELAEIQMLADAAAAPDEVEDHGSDSASMHH